jgi:hypothetical protein
MEQYQLFELLLVAILALLFRLLMTALISHSVAAARAIVEKHD